MRPDNDTYFLGIAEAVSKRATCPRRSVGCVLVDKDFQIIGTGYNALARGLPHCTNNNPCPGKDDASGDSSRCYARHAEQIATTKCSDIYRIHTCYTTTQPCSNCVRLLLDTSCERIVFRDSYPDIEGKALWLGQGYDWVQI